MKKIVVAVVVVVVLAGAGLLIRQRQSASATPAVAVAAAQAPIELLDSDLAPVRTQPINRVLPISGSVKATNQAVIKAKVSGDILQVLVKEGQVVAQGQVLAQIDTTEFAAKAAERDAMLKNAQAQLTMAERTFTNNKALVDKGFISMSALDTSQDTVMANKAQVNAQQQQLLQAQKTLADATVRAPLAGVVTEKLVSAGDKASPDTKLFTIVDPRSLEFEAALNPTDAAQLAPGAVLNLTAEGLAPVQASIARINAAVSASSRTVTVYASVPADSGLKSGQFVSGVVRISGSEALSVVPVDSVRDEGGRQVVYTVVKGDAGEVLSAVPVKLGQRGELADGQVVVQVTGIAAGTRIVARNLGPMRMGVPLKIGSSTAKTAG
jgi:RND family efflux transporter MFP subunit